MTDEAKLAALLHPWTCTRVEANHPDTDEPWLCRRAAADVAFRLTEHPPVDPEPVLPINEPAHHAHDGLGIHLTLTHHRKDDYR